MNQKLIALTFAGVAFAAAPVEITNGVITDTMCGAKHSMVKDQLDDACVRMCVKGSSEYALYDGSKVWKLSDQKAAAKFSAKKVKVKGTPESRSGKIKVSSIELLD